MIRELLAGRFAKTMLLLWVCAVASSASAATIAERSKAVDEIFAGLIKPNGPGAAVGLYQGGKLLLSRGYGSANLDYNLPITPDTIFNLASVSKQFTAFSIALLARDGKLKLDADIRTYLPDFPDVGAVVTVADLVHHLSGVRDYIALGALSGHDDESLLRQAQAINLVYHQRSLSFSPGTRYEYSNSGYALLAEIVHSVSGKTLREFMQERIFAPLGMANTRVRDDLSRIEPGYAAGYERNQDDSGWNRAVYNRVAVGPGNLLSNVGDLVKWLGNFAHPVVGDRALIEQISAPVKLRDGTAVNYGFGLTREQVIGHKAVMHTGGISGFSTVAVYFPDDDFGIVVLANHGFDASKAAEQVAGIFLEPRAASAKQDEEQKPAADKPSPVPTPLSAAALSALAGNYRSDEIDTTYQLVIVERKVTLRSLYLTQPQELTLSAADRFAAKSGPLEGLEVSVERAADGKPAALLFDFYRLRGLRLARSK